jgi:hypothetical protein
MIQLILAIVGASALVVLVFFFRYFLTGTGGLIAWASHAGAKGWAVFILCWIFFTPLMVIGSVIYGYKLSQDAY